jgi:hypothetical protein
LKSKKPEALILLSLALFVNLAFIYGFFTRPIIEYKLTTPLDYNETINLNNENFSVTLEAVNKGRASAKITLTIRIYNMSLINSYEYPVETIGEFSEISFPLKNVIMKNQKTEFTIDLNAEDNSSHLVLFYYIEINTDSIDFHKNFALFKPQRPTAIILKNIGENHFMRVKER